MSERNKNTSWQDEDNRTYHLEPGGGEETNVPKTASKPLGMGFHWFKTHVLAVISLIANLIYAFYSAVGGLSGSGYYYLVCLVCNIIVLILDGILVANWNVYSKEVYKAAIATEILSMVSATITLFSNVVIDSSYTSIFANLFVFLCCLAVFLCIIHYYKKRKPIFYANEIVLDKHYSPSKKEDYSSVTQNEDSVSGKHQRRHVYSPPIQERTQTPNHVYNNYQTTVFEEQVNSRSLKLVLVVFLVIILIVVLYIGSYHVSWHSAAVCDFQKADKWLIAPSITEIHDPGYSKYVNAGLLYQDGYLQAAENAFYQGDYCIADEDLSDDELYRKAKNQIEYGDYTGAIRTLSSLEDKQYKDSVILQQEATLKRALVYAENEQYSIALDDIHEVVACGYPEATKIQEEIEISAYDYAVGLYHNGDYNNAYSIFKRIDIERAKDYSDLCTCHLFTLFFASYERLCELIGFEDAGSLMFSDNRRHSLEFMEGTFSGDGISMKTWNTSGSEYSSYWTIPDVPDGQWYYQNGQFYVNDVARFNIEAISKDSIKITVLASEKAYKLFRQ